MNTTRHGLVEALFRSRPGEWIDGRELAHVGGYAAWSVRVREVRRRLVAAGEGTIENQTRRHDWGTESRYRFVPAAPLEARPILEAADPAPARA